jgi:hypothetical protein
MNVGEECKSYSAVRGGPYDGLRNAFYSEQSDILDMRALSTMQCEQASSESIESRPEERNQHARDCHFIWFI